MWRWVTANAAHAWLWCHAEWEVALRFLVRRVMHLPDRLRLCAFQPLTGRDHSLSVQKCRVPLCHRPPLAMCWVGRPTELVTCCNSTATLNIHCTADPSSCAKTAAVGATNHQLVSLNTKGAQACTYPGTTISGRMSSVKFYYKIGETVSFTCEPGYRLKGAPMLRCLKNRKWSNAIPLCAPISNYTSPDSLVMLNGDIDAMLSDDALLTHDVLKRRETPAILSPESYKAAMTRVAASKMLWRSSIETYKNRVFRVNRLIRRDTKR